MTIHKTPLRVQPQPNTTIPDLLLERLKKTPKDTLFRLPTKDGWENLSTQQFYDRVIKLAKGFIASGVQPGDRIGLMCSPRFEWTLIDFALWFAGAMCVPIYETSSPKQIHWIMSTSGATRIFLETEEMFARFDEVHPDLASVKNVWHIDLDDIEKICAKGTGITDQEVDDRRSLATGSDIATIIYTSGSTGISKGCALTHSNFVNLCLNSDVEFPEMLHPEGGASILLFMTIAHIFSRFISIAGITSGVVVAYEPDPKKLLKSLSQIDSTFLLAVPRVFEKIYNTAEQHAYAKRKGKIFDAAVATAQEYSRAKEMKASLSFGLKLRHKLYDKLVYSKIRNLLGKKVRFAFSAAAPLNPEIAHFFHAAGITILDGWGLTETTAPLTVNRPNRQKIGTVGYPLPGVQIRLNGDNEILAKGTNVFSSYWNNPEETQNAFEDGWFKTGDLGHIDNEGFLTLTGRKKEIIITSSGKNVSPFLLESKLNIHPLISQILIVGDRRPFISALITLAEEMLPIWLKGHHQPNMTLAEAANSPFIRTEIQSAVDQANTHVSRAESIRSFVILPEDFTHTKDQLTAKMTLKRTVLLEDYKEIIDNLYAAKSPPKIPH